MREYQTQQIILSQIPPTAFTVLKTTPGLGKCFVIEKLVHSGNNTTDGALYLETADGVTVMIFNSVSPPVVFDFDYKWPVNTQLGFRCITSGTLHELIINYHIEGAK